MQSYASMQAEIALKHDGECVGFLRANATNDDSTDMKSEEILEKWQPSA